MERSCRFFSFLQLWLSSRCGPPQTTRLLELVAAAAAAAQRWQPLPEAQRTLVAAIGTSLRPLLLRLPLLVKEHRCQERVAGLRVTERRARQTQAPELVSSEGVDDTVQRRLRSGTYGVLHFIPKEQSVRVCDFTLSSACAPARCQ